MYGLPQSTEVNKQLPKKAIYAKFDLKPSQREHFDEDVSKLMISNVISTSTIPALHKGENVDCIYVVDVQLKRKEYDEKNICLLSKLIHQKIIFILRFDIFAKEAIFHSKLISSQWRDVSSLIISLSGLSLDSVWENQIISLGNIEIDSGNSLDEQIAINEEREKLIKKIHLLENKLRREKQTRKKLEFFDEIKKIKKYLNNGQVEDANS